MGLGGLLLVVRSSGRPAAAARYCFCLSAVALLADLLVLVLVRLAHPTRRRNGLAVPAAGENRRPYGAKKYLYE
jgi:hypothetical protein